MLTSKRPPPARLSWRAFLLKMGTYGFIRFNIPLFPEAALRFAPWIAGLGVIGILWYGAVALRTPSAMPKSWLLTLLSAIWDS
jgi:NADH:ubiquinone oxidoreductase subunit 4 (subunit M)